MKKEKTKSPWVYPESAALFNLSPWGNMGLVLSIIVGSCLLGTFILSSFVEKNTKIFWNFLQDVTPENIQEIELHKVDAKGNDLGDVIVVTDASQIEQLVSIFDTVQEHQIHFMGQRLTYEKIKILLSNNQTIEFDCYTVEGEGKTVFIDSIWIKPNLYSFGNGYAKFPAPKFYNWLLSIGVDIQ